MAAILQAFMNGKWVEIPALQGEDGFSPKVTVADEGDKITITVEDKNGKKTISYAKGAGDMLKSVYDTDGDGAVDQAESATKAEDADKLGGELPSAYRKTADLIDYQTEVTNKPTIPTIDTAVTEGSANAVSGGAVKTYVDGKETELQTDIDARPTLEAFYVQFPASGWMLDADGSIYLQTVEADLNPETDKIFVDINLSNAYKDELREAWAELRNFSIMEGQLCGYFWTAPTVDMTVTVFRFRRA